MLIQWIVSFVLFLPVIFGDTTVKTTTGSVRGTTVELPNGEQVEAFLGIPFAEPPIGKFRFEKPIPIKPWEREYNATYLPPPCYQNYTTIFYWTPNVQRMSEDCLYLNVWMPGSVQDTKPKAVFVWIHGGAFNIGSSEMEVYNGAMLASRGNILVISMNYRVGIFGFLTTPIQDAAGNMGIYDQLLAMRWIRANVKAFGGDPELITLAGESAGAMSVSLFLVSPLTRGFVKRAILESGGLIHPKGAMSVQDMLLVGEKIAIRAGCSSNDANMTTSPKLVVDCLKHVPANVISEAEGYIMKTNPITATPVCCDDLIPRNPADLIKEGLSQGTELLIGANRDEGSNFLTFLMPEFFGVYGKNAISSLKKRLAGYIIKNIFMQTEQESPENIAKFYIEGNGNRMLNNDLDDKLDYIKTAVYDSIGDYMILCSTLFVADFISIGSKPVYFYMFTHRPSTTVNEEWMGVTHFDEVPFVFGRPLMGDKNYSLIDQEISRNMMDRWIAFTKTGNPNIPDAPEWIPYKWNDPYYLEIGDTERLRKKPDNYRCEFWRERFNASVDQFLNEFNDSFVNEFNSSLDPFGNEFSSSLDPFVNEFNSSSDPFGNESKDVSFGEKDTFRRRSEISKSNSQVPASLAIFLCLITITIVAN